MAFGLHSSRARIEPPAGAAMPELQTVQPPKAVYYPHVAFGSTAWVKSALLYWETVVRAKLPHSSPHDDPEIQQLVEAGAIEEIAPDPRRRQAMPEVAHRLEELIRALGGRVPAGIPGIGTPRGTSPEREAGVRAEIVEGLRTHPLARKAFLEAPDQARALFFVVWLDIVAREKQFAPVTDDPIFDAIKTYLDHDKVTDDPKKVTDTDGHVIAQLSLPTPSLEAIAQLPVKQLLEIRTRYAAQRRHFREQVQQQLTAIAELPTREAIEEQLHAFRDSIHDDLEAAREAVKDARVKERWTMLGISGPASLAAGVSIAAAASPVLGPIGGAGTLALGVTSWFMRQRKGSTLPNNYLLSVDTAVKDLSQGLTRALHDLVHG
jgi:hypothetical protein